MTTTTTTTSDTIKGIAIVLFIIGMVIFAVTRIHFFIV